MSNWGKVKAVANVLTDGQAEEEDDDKPIYEIDPPPEPKYEQLNTGDFHTDYVYFIM